MIKPWRTVSSKSLGDFRVFKLRSDLKVSPRTGEQHDFVVLEPSNWVNVIAITPDQQIVLVQQYRHGSDTVELEIPGGIMDPEDVSPVATGVRELREETGYQGEKPRLIGTVFSNPAIMTNSTFTVLVENCRPTGKLELDHTEDLATQLVPIKDIPAMVSAGKFGHSLVVAALYFYALLPKQT